MRCRCERSTGGCCRGVTMAKKSNGVAAGRAALCSVSEGVEAGAGELFEVGAVAALFGGDGFDAGSGFARCDVVAVAVGELEAAVGVSDDVPVPFVHAAMAAVAAQEHAVVDVGGSLVVPLVYVVGVAVFGRRPQHRQPPSRATIARNWSGVKVRVDRPSRAARRFRRGRALGLASQAMRRAVSGEMRVPSARRHSPTWSPRNVAASVRTSTWGRFPRAGLPAR